MEMIELRQEILSCARRYFHVASEYQSRFIPGKTYIPPAKQVLDEEDLVGLIDCAMDFQYAGGSRLKAFEAALGAEFFPHHSRPLFVNSGSSANLVAMSVLGSPALKEAGFSPLLPGDEVITAAAGFPSTVAPIVQNGWVPVFVDVDRTTLNCLPETIMRARTTKTRAIVLAHTLGNPYRADILRKWCDGEHIYLIEDCCDALGAQINGMRVGSFGELSTLSFYPAHHISTGEGGAVMARNPKLRKIAASYRDWGRDCWCAPGKDDTCGKRFCWKLGNLPEGYDHKYIYTHLGYNLKGTEMEGSLGLSQLPKAKGFIKARRDNYVALHQGIRSSPLLSAYLKPVIATPNTEPSWFGFAMHCQGVGRHALTQYLEKHQVGTRLLFAGNLTKQPAYADVSYKVHEKLENTDFIMNQTFWVGLHPGIDERHIQYMLEQLEAGVRKQVS